MAIQFGSGVFWVSFKKCPHDDERLESWVNKRKELDVFSPSTGGAAGHEHQADGADEKKTGVHGFAAVQQIHSRCLLSHPSWM